MSVNSLKEIEQFITVNFAGDADYFGVLKEKKTIKFLPGHAAKLINFITEIKKLKARRAVSTELRQDLL